MIVKVGEGDKIAKAATDFSYRVLYFADAVNESAAKNYAVTHTDSPWLLFLDDNIEAIGPDWLTIMAEHVQRPETGAVGPRLINPGGTIEHAGLVLGVNGIAQSAFRGFPAGHPGVNRQLQMTRNYSAVSGACLLMRREVFQQIGGFDEKLSGALADCRSLPQNATRGIPDRLHAAGKTSLGCRRHLDGRRWRRSSHARALVGCVRA